MSAPTPELPAIVTTHLELLADQLLHGEIGLQDLPPAVAAFYHLGATEPQLAAQARIRDLEYECDRLYLAVAHPKQRALELQNRLNHRYVTRAA